MTSFTFFNIPYLSLQNHVCHYSSQKKGKYHVIWQQDKIMRRDKITGSQLIRYEDQHSHMTSYWWHHQWHHWCTASVHSLNVQSFCAQPCTALHSSSHSDSSWLIEHCISKAHGLLTHSDSFWLSSIAFILFYFLLTQNDLVAQLFKNLYKPPTFPPKGRAHLSPQPPPSPQFSSSQQLITILCCSSLPV